jgi:Fe-S cluster assembly protein SufD
MQSLINLQKETIIKLASGSDTFLVERLAGDDCLPERNFSLGENARANYLLVVTKGASLDNIYRSWQLETGAVLKTYYLFLESTASVWHLQHRLADRARIENHSLFLGRGQDNLQVKADYDFAGQGSYGRVQVDAWLDNESRLRYDANLNVLAAAQQSDTRVDMRLRLASQTARGQLIPGLNIAANDVRAGHSASTFQLSKEDLFYLRSRGLSPEAAQKLFALSLSRNFVKGLDDAELSSEILSLISARL